MIRKEDITKKSLSLIRSIENISPNTTEHANHQLALDSGLL